MVTLYYPPNSQTHRQTAFFYAFGRKFRKTAVVWEPFRLDASFAARFVETARLVRWVESAEGLNAKVKSRCLQVLADCPPKVRVILDPSRISFDVTVVDEGGQAHFFEFHENQHAGLTVNRPEKIYDIDGKAVSVPRYIQRLYRDIWRLEHVRPFQIVWADWFDLNKQSYRPALLPGFREHALPNKLRFEPFLAVSER